MLAALLYLGAGLGMGLCGLIRPVPPQQQLTPQLLPYTLGMVVLDIAAPILLMLGLARTAAAHVSLLNNFEIVATSVIALLLFHEKISRRVWAAIALITLASGLLSFEGTESLRFSAGSLLVLGACLCWGGKTTAPVPFPKKAPYRSSRSRAFFRGLARFWWLFFPVSISPKWAMSCLPCCWAFSPTG